MTRSRGVLPRRVFWTEAEIELLRREYPDTPTEALAVFLGVDVKRVHAKAGRLGLKKSPAFFAAGYGGRLDPGQRVSPATEFKPGQPSHNKGLRRPGYAAGRMAQTQYTPGSRPHNWVPVGSVRINSDGYLDCKVSDTGHPPRDWLAVHRLVWIAAHGPVPAGHVVVFKPGKRTTDAVAITPDVLELVTRRELLRRNSIHNLPGELVETIRLVGAIRRRINRHKEQA